jgi:hypothetical protein
MHRVILHGSLNGTIPCRRKKHPLISYLALELRTANQRASCRGQGPKEPGGGQSSRSTLRQLQNNGREVERM